jgi:hypothetical protein
MKLGFFIWNNLMGSPEKETRIYVDAIPRKRHFDRHFSPSKKDHHE